MRSEVEAQGDRLPKSDARQSASGIDDLKEKRPQCHVTTAARVAAGSRGNLAD